MLDLGVSEFSNPSSKTASRVREDLLTCVDLGGENPSASRLERSLRVPGVQLLFPLILHDWPLAVPSAQTKAWPLPTATAASLAFPGEALRPTRRYPLGALRAIEVPVA